MLKNYLTIALRNLRKHKGYTFINVFGLALGLGCAALIALFVRHELSYDRFHEHADRVYRVTYEFTAPDPRHLATTPPPLGPTLTETYPDVLHAARLREPHPSVFTRGDERFYESDFFYADASFLQIFSFPLQSGDPATALAAPNTVVLTPAAARKYFGDVDPLGQTLAMNDEDLTVTGVLEPIPATSHLDFDFLVSFSTFRVPHGYPVTLDDWRWGSFHTYVLLAEDADPGALEAQLPELLEANLTAERAQRSLLHLQPLGDIYLGAPAHPAAASGNSAYLYGLGTVALLILLLAGFNFTNLATAHAIRRSKEVSVRKVIGAYRGQLRLQFLGESVFVAFLSLGLAAVLVMAALGLSEALFGQPLVLDRSTLLVLVPAFVCLAGVVGIMAGSYPAFVLSRFQPARALKGDATGVFSQGRLRATLVVLQFAIAVALLAGSLIVTQQMRFIQDKELGFDREQVVALHILGTELQDRYPEIRETLLQNPNVVRVTKGGDLFDGDTGSVPIYPEGTGDESLRNMGIYSLYYDFPETLGMEVIAGRTPSEAFASDSSAIMLNRTAADILAASVPGWENPVGRQLRVGDIMEGEVVGVVEDFHFASLHEAIEPLVLYFPRALIDKVLVRVRPGDAPALLASLEDDWSRVVPDLPFRYTFLDEHVQALYETDERFARLTTFFTFLTVLVAGLGLYGLVAFVTQLRTREIGIRKVLGASVQSVVALLSKRFLAYVLVANLVAWPLAWLAMDRWLDGFAYRVEIGPGVFLLSGLAALVLALLAMGSHAVRAATADPVRALHHE